MLFIHPMWDNEAQRIGKQKCTPTGYLLHQISDLISISGLLILLGVLLYFLVVAVLGSFRPVRLWWLTVPFLVDFCGDLLLQYSWWLAHRKEFHYDYDLRRATWTEKGMQQSYPPKP